MRREPRCPALALMLVTALAAAMASSARADDAPGSSRGGEASGPPGLLWGRLAVEEESPDGPWTPLGDVEIFVYPFAPRVLADLEGIRRSARDSAVEFETAVTRLRGRLRAYRAELQTPNDEGGVRQRVTDPAGLFVFEELPPGEWLFVALRVVPYASAAWHRDRRRADARESAFLPSRERRLAQRAEVWVTRVSVSPGERTRLFLTDRSRWLVGPVR